MRHYEEVLEHNVEASDNNAEALGGNVEASVHRKMKTKGARVKENRHNTNTML